MGAVTVLNLHETKWAGRAEYVGRGSVLGNPYVLDRDGDRKTVLKHYRALLGEMVSAGREGAYARLAAATEDHGLACIKAKQVEDLGYRKAVWDALEGLRLRLAAGEDLILLCYCKPFDCHGDLIARYLLWAVQTPVSQSKV